MEVFSYWWVIAKTFDPVNWLIELSDKFWNLVRGMEEGYNTKNPAFCTSTRLVFCDRTSEEIEVKNVSGN